MTAFSSPPRVEDAVLSSKYFARPDSYDEMVDRDGGIRAHWKAFVRHLDGFAPGELKGRWEQARQLIHDNGISFNVYGDPRGMERPWQLSPIPVLIAPDEFRELSAGLTQRGRLLDRLLADLYGPQRALSEGWLPPELILGHPGFLRPCHGVVPSRGRFLHFYAADLVRLPSGRFHVVIDRTQAPAGAGYALENRIIVSRVLPEVFRDCNIERLAVFFRTVRETLASLAPAHRDNPRVVLLSPGPYNATYFEQAFLAQYLGYMLVDGADLTVRDGRVFLKTLGGLHAVDVILRRLNDDYCDPLELRDDSTLGVPGLLQAVRAGHVTVANALGTGLLQTPAILPFLPRICRGLLGEELKLPSVETWWCGEPASLSHVMANLEHMIVKSAYPVGVGETFFCEALTSPERSALASRMRAAPGHWVAQTRVPLSMTPVIDGGELQPRQLVMRSFLVARGGVDDGDGYEVMPGALSLVGGSPGEREISMQGGSGSNDTWVVSGGVVSTFSLLPRPSQPLELSRGGGDLPSRVADNLFWLGRYTERADAIARLARTISGRLAEQMDPGSFRETEVGPLLAALRDQTRIAAGVSAPNELPAHRSAENELLESLFAVGHPGTLRSAIQATHRVAGVVRDRISSDTWRILTSLQQDLPEIDHVGHGQGAHGSTSSGSPATANGDGFTDATARDSARLAEPRGRGNRGSELAALSTGLDRVVMRLAALGGVVMESMTRGQAWRFLDMGRRLERATNLVLTLRSTLAAVHVGPERSLTQGPLLEALLEVADSVMTYRRRYLATLQVAPVVDLLLTDETNPRSVVFQLALLGDHLQQLPRDPTRGHAAAAEGIVLGALARLRSTDVEAISEPDDHGGRPELAALLGDLVRELPTVSEALTGQYLNHAIASRQLADGSSSLATDNHYMNEGRGRRGGAGGGWPGEAEDA